MTRIGVDTLSDIGRDEKAITTHAEYVAKVKAAGLSDVVWHSRGGELKAFVPFDAYREAVEALRDLDAWAGRMPDAGFTADDPRWDWWHQRPRVDHLLGGR